jgi:hypothetical protein
MFVRVGPLKEKVYFIPTWSWRLFVTLNLSQLHGPNVEQKWDPRKCQWIMRAFWDIQITHETCEFFVVRYSNDSKFVNIWFIFGGLMRILSKCSQRFEPKKKVDNIHLRRSETLKPKCNNNAWTKKCPQVLHQEVVCLLLFWISCIDQEQQHY